MGSNVFKRLASLITVGDLQSPLGPTVTHDTTVFAIWDDLEENETDAFWLVERNGGIVGYIYPTELEADEDDAVGDHAAPINPAEIVSSNLTALAAAELFARTGQPWFFVLNGDRLDGVLFYHDLFKPEFRVCLFALTLQLEEAALGLIMAEPRESWSVLSESRRQKAESIARLRYADRRTSTSERRLLACTTFIDKATILGKRKLVPDVAPPEIRRLFKEAERVRNRCAHPDNRGGWNAVILDREPLAVFLQSCQRLLQAMPPVDYDNRIWS